jgi:hypothetical protein
MTSIYYPLILPLFAALYYAVDMALNWLEIYVGDMGDWSLTTDLNRELEGVVVVVSRPASETASPTPINPQELRNTLGEGLPAQEQDQPVETEESAPEEQPPQEEPSRTTPHSPFSPMQQFAFEEPTSLPSTPLEPQHQQPDSAHVITEEKDVEEDKDEPDPAAADEDDVPESFSRAAEFDRPTPSPLLLLGEQVKEEPTPVVEEELVQEPSSEAADDDDGINNGINEVIVESHETDANRVVETQVPFAALVVEEQPLATHDTLVVAPTDEATALELPVAAESVDIQETDLVPVSAANSDAETPTLTEEDGAAHETCEEEEPCLVQIIDGTVGLGEPDISCGEDDEPCLVQIIDGTVGLGEPDISCGEDDEPCLVQIIDGTVDLGEPEDGALPVIINNSPVIINKPPVRKKTSSKKLGSFKDSRIEGCAWLQKARKVKATTTPERAPPRLTTVQDYRNAGLIEELPVGIAQGPDTRTVNACVFIAFCNVRGFLEKGDFLTATEVVNILKNEAGDVARTCRDLIFKGGVEEHHDSKMVDIFEASSHFDITEHSARIKYLDSVFANQSADFAAGVDRCLEIVTDPNLREVAFVVNIHLHCVMFGKIGPTYQMIDLLSSGRIVTFKNDDAFRTYVRSYIRPNHAADQFHVSIYTVSEDAPPPTLTGQVTTVPISAEDDIQIQSSVPEIVEEEALSDQEQVELATAIELSLADENEQVSQRSIASEEEQGTVECEDAGDCSTAAGQSTIHKEDSAYVPSVAPDADEAVLEESNQPSQGDSSIQPTTTTILPLASPKEPLRGVVDPSSASPIGGNTRGSVAPPARLQRRRKKNLASPKVLASRKIVRTNFHKFHPTEKAVPDILLEGSEKKSSLQIAVEEMQLEKARSAAAYAKNFKKAVSVLEEADNRDQVPYNPIWVPHFYGVQLGPILRANLHFVGETLSSLDSSASPSKRKFAARTNTVVDNGMENTEVPLKKQKVW